MLLLRALLLVSIFALPVRALAQDDGTPGIPPPPPPSAGETAPAPAEEAETDETPPPEREAEPERATATEAPPAPTGTESAPAPRPEASSSSRRPARPRDRRPSGLAPSPSGETGILRVASADSTAPGIMRVGLGLEFFTLSDFFAEGDENTRVAGVLSLSGSPIDYVEAWLNIRAISNSNNLTTPNLLQSQGDLQLGLKGFYPVADLASVGADAQVTLLSGIGEAGYDFGASEVRLRGLLTSDFSRAPEQIPLRIHLNAGVVIDNSDNLLAEGEELSQAESFALGIYEYDRVVVGAGVEVPVPYVTPYLEYSVAFPIDYLATPGVVVTGSGLRAAQDGMPVARNQVARPAVQRIIPQRLTPGVRVRPVEGLSIDVAVEIGLTPDQALGVPAVPDYNVITLLSYAVDPFGVRGGGGGPSGPPVAVPVIVPEASPENTRALGGRISGVVIDKASGEPLPDAIVSVGDALPVATNAEGRFEAAQLTPGPATMTVRKPGFSPGQAELTIVEGEPAEVEVVLEPEIQVGKVQGAVVDATGAAVPGASVIITSVGGNDARTVETGPSGRFEAEVDAGEQRITVSADGFLRTGRAVKVEPGETAPQVALQLTPRGDVGARVDGDRLALPEPLVYAKGEVVPNATARRGLDLVTDLLLADATLKVEVGGHTDSRGNELDNREVSANRARAARDYLLEHGVPPDQVTAEGYGSTRPVAPNLTRAGRERNRRVDFVVR